MTGAGTCTLFAAGVQVSGQVAQPPHSVVVPTRILPICIPDIQSRDLQNILNWTVWKKALKKQRHLQAAIPKSLKKQQHLQATIPKSLQKQRYLQATIPKSLVKQLHLQATIHKSL